jgi:hypothetical protein
MGRTLRARGVVVVGTAALAGLLALPASGAAATWTFGYTGGMQTWVVPAGVTSAHFDIYGAAGGEPYYATFNPGKGGRAQAELPLTPGSTVHIAVGGKGGYPAGDPGYNGGGRGSEYGGGGATDIRIGGTGLNDRVLVAGGGGGTAEYSGDSGGDGGGLTGKAGSGAFGGGGGTQTAGGSGTYPDWNGSFGQGGAAGNPGPNATGGGGGGWYGGAAGPGGGGGGSGYGPSGTDFATGVSGGNGSVTITVLAASSTPTLGSHLGGAMKGFGVVKPKTVFLGGDPTGLVTKLTWKSWGSLVTLGTGTGYYPPPGKPVAAAVKVPVTLDASELGTCKGHKAYRRLSFTFHYKGKAIKGSVWGICGHLTAG